MEYLKKPFHLPEKREALFALTAAAMIWGANAPISKWALQFGSIETLGFLRFFLALLFFWVLFKPPLHIRRADWKLVFFCGFIGISLHILFLYAGLQLTSSINAAILASSVPILSLFFTKFFLHEKIVKQFFIGGMVGIVGVLLIILQPIVEEGISANVIGNVLLVGSVMTFIVAEIFAKKLYKKGYHPTTVTAYSYIIGTVSFLPFFLGDVIRNGTYFINTNFLLGLSFIIVFSSLIAIPCWQWGISKLAVSRVGFFLYLDPVIAFIVAFFLLGEVITPHMIIGTIFIFIGLYIAENTIHFPHFHLYHAHIRERKQR